MSDKNATTLRAVDTPRQDERTKAEQFAAYMARVITDRRTPKAAQRVIGGILVALISNSSGYAWHTDAEGLNFMLPRLLDNMNEQFADGIMEATMEAVDNLLPGQLGQELFRGDKEEGRAS